ncbi:MAG TPA: GNAT family N-acetyltransferase [Mycobacteriales bacterium]|nr:GNAT family N-acetyltransferase [Mycobacteriales bacterium]
MPAELLAAQSVERRTEQWSEMLGRDGLTFVAELDQTVVGFAHAGKSRDADLPEVAELYAIYADPSVWDRRVGHALHDAVLDALRAGGFDRCLLWVLEGNQRAIGFYERHGWVADGRTKDDVRDGVTLVERRYLLDL